MNSAPSPALAILSPQSARPSRRSWLTSLLAAAIAVAAAGGCSVSAEADVPDLAVTQHDIAVTGIPMAGRVGDVSTHFAFTQKLPSIDLPDSVESKVESAKIELTAKRGITDFSFLKALRVTITPSGSPAPIDLVEYEKKDGAIVGKSLLVDSLNAADILKQWKETAVFDLQVAGDLPEADWTIDLTVHLNGKFSYKY
jgi:hypothetical protein